MYFMNSVCYTWASNPLCLDVIIFFSIKYSKQKLPDVLVSPKVKELERERALKWGKMLRNWDKFQGTDTVCTVVYIVAGCVYVN